MELLRAVQRLVPAGRKPTGPLDWELIPAERLSHADRAGVLNAAYANYYVPMHMTADQVAAMERGYDIDLGRSVAAVAGREPVGMALLGRRGDRAWLGSVGVIPAWRRRGLARALAGRVIAAAAGAGAREMTLEVIAQNMSARNLYDALGFRPVRELLTWRRGADADPLPIPEERLAHAAPLDLLAQFTAWHDQPACWQSEEVTLRNQAYRLAGYRLDLEGQPAAYALVGGADDAVWVMDVGISPQFGPVRAGRPLLQALANSYFGKAMTLMNMPADSGVCRVLAALRFLVTVRQWEMGLELTSPPGPLS
ncbi:MAG: GNAT family N-acetyltransferase [Chloroflexi bacterium]|nr:GNAT family N-acetyltransferase [Chloroflexota bacterium]